ncbi:MAG: EpsG family protein [Bacteroidales bacterium]|nr:EpsG family protein [Bacteroidales bacterium]
MYYIVFILVIIGVIKESFTGRRSVKLFNIIFLILTLMSVFRYGQGTDYFSYEHEYKYLIMTWEHIKSGKDSGYLLLVMIGQYIKLPFEYFIGIIASFVMFIWYQFLRKECNFSFLALLLFYVLLFFVNINSAIRNSIAFAVYLYWAYPCLINNKIIKYIFIVILASFFHLSLLILVFLPLFRNIVTNNTRLYIILFSFILMFFGIEWIIPILPSFLRNRIDLYIYSYQVNDNFIYARIIRIFYIIPIIYLIRTQSENSMTWEKYNFFIGTFFFYSLFSFSTDVSSRIFAYCIPFLCIILSRSNLNLTTIRKYIILYYMLILNVIFFKNFVEFSKQGAYDQNISWYNFPYTSIFNKEEVSKIRETTFYIE